MLDQDLISWIDLCLAAIDALGPDIYHVDLHRPDEFSAAESEWRLPIRFPWGTTHLLLFQHDRAGAWHPALEQVA